MGSARDPAGIPEGSGAKRRDPAKMYPIFYRGSSVRSGGFYNIKRGKERKKRRVLEFYKRLLSFSSALMIALFMSKTH